MNSGLLAAVVLLAPLTSCVAVMQQQSAATPQRPTFSSDTHTTGERTFELEAGLDIDPDDLFAIPAKLKYGIDSTSEVFVGWTPFLAVDQPGDDGEGFGDLFLGYRQRLSDDTPHDPAYAFQLSAKLPTADEDEGLGNGETDLFAAGIAEKDLEQLRVSGFYQLGLLGKVGDGGLDLQHGLAAVATIPLQGHFDAFGEATFIWEPARDNEILYGTFGVTYALAPALVFDAALRIGLTNDAPDLQVLVGMTQNFGRLSHLRKPGAQGR